MCIRDRTLAGEERDPAVLDYLRDKYRLNDPLPMQYAAWAGQVLQGDLGKSLRTDVPVTTLIAQKLPVTLQLAAMAMFFALLVGIPMGIVAAVRKGKPVEIDVYKRQGSARGSAPTAASRRVRRRR